MNFSVWSSVFQKLQSNSQKKKIKNNTVYNKLVVNKTKVEKNYDGRGEAKTKHFSVHGHQRGQTSRGADEIMQVHQQDYILDPRFDIL